MAHSPYHSIGPLKSPPPTYSPIKIPKVNGEFTDPAQVKPPRSILRTPGQRKKTPPAGPNKIPDHFERNPAGPKVSQKAYIKWA
jgi:hypothetical protein